MPLSGVLMLGVIAALLAGLAVRDHRARQAARRRLLDRCVEHFDVHAQTCGGDGFPILDGLCGGRHVDVRLISDGMTIRRLPQLWLQVTHLVALEGVSGVAVLVRPSGGEFFSLTSGFHHILEAPPSFPRELIVRGECARSADVLAWLAGPMAAILADARVKEIAVTRRGLRIVRQADEGRRGDYLLLRQAAFEMAPVAAETLAAAIAGIDALRAATERSSREPVPA